MALVEFVLVVPAAFILIFSMINFGFALYTYNLVTNAARMGARYAMVRGSSCSASGCPATSASIQTWVQGQSPGFINPNSLTVTTTWASYGACTTSPYEGAGCQVTVTVSYPFALVIHPIVHANWTISSTSQMIIAQ